MEVNINSIHQFYSLFILFQKLRDIQQAKKHFEVKKSFEISLIYFPFQNAIRTEYAPIIDPIEASLDEKYGQLERQHADFAMHIQTQISQIQQQILQFHQVQQQTPPPLPPPPHLMNNTFGNFKFL
jgi:hypothetical protein